MKVIFKQIISSVIENSDTDFLSSSFILMFVFFFDCIYIFQVKN